MNTTIYGLVKFGNASEVEIEGVGSILFSVKMGRSRLLTGVYYIPAVRNSIISLGQLDEGSSCMEIEARVLCIWDHQ